MNLLLSCETILILLLTDHTDRTSEKIRAIGAIRELLCRVSVAIAKNSRHW